MPKTSVLPGDVDYYEIAVRQFQHQVLPTGMPKTTVWGYGSTTYPTTFSYPANTIEAAVDKPVRVKWINDLVDANGNFLPHLLPIDQTLHWANPPGPRDMRGTDPTPYIGPVPISVHLHGSHVGPESDGYPQAWWLPAANNITCIEDDPVNGNFWCKGTNYDQFDPANDQAGTAVFQYSNDQRATALWFHDHTLGMTRANVYAGPIGFYLLRGGASDLPAGTLPQGPYEVPIAIQDRSFNNNGSLFYPKNRAFFEGLLVGQLKIPFIPDPVIYPDSSTTGDSDVSPIWNPEFFGNTMVVNGKTWPVLNVEQRRYRLRFLNGSDSRFLILRLVTGDPTGRPATSALPFWQIGTEGGFLSAPVKLNTLLIALAERADVIVDFSSLPVGAAVYLINEVPDEPCGGGVPGVDFPFSDPGTTGQVMKFVVGARTSRDTSVSPNKLMLPGLTPLGAATNVRTLSLNGNESATVLVSTDINGNIVLDPAGVPFGPTSAQLGTVESGFAVPKAWMDNISENPDLNATEIWEIYNFTADAHPIHVHQTMFQVVNRQALKIDPATEMPIQPVQLSGKPFKPEVWETGFKDTVISYPGQVTRIKVFFDIPGLYVWHCHILSHEDNEMMRPFCVGDLDNCM